MAQRLTTSYLSTNRPGAYPRITVKDSPIGIGDTGIVAIFGEADGGEYFENEDLKLNYFSGEQTDRVTEKYIRGPVVDAMRMLASSSSDRDIVGAPSRIYIIKTNNSTKASVVINDFFGSAAGTLQDKNFGIDGNKYFYEISEVRAEAAPTVISSNVIPLNDAKEKTEIEILNDVNSTYSGQYIEFYAANDKTGYYVYFDDTGAVVDPARTGLFNGNGIRVDIQNATTAAGIALAMASAINADANEYFTASIDPVNNVKVVVENVEAGKSSDAATDVLVGDATIEVVVPGSDIAKEEVSDIHFNNPENSNNYDQKYFIINNARDKKDWGVWYASSNTVLAPTGAGVPDDLIKVSIDSTASTASIASATRAAINSHPEASEDFIASIKATDSGVVVIKNKLPGPATSVENAPGTDGIPNALKSTIIIDGIAGSVSQVEEVVFTVAENNQGNYHDKYFTIYDNLNNAYNILFDDGINASTPTGGTDIVVPIVRGDSVISIVDAIITAVAAYGFPAGADITPSVSSSVNQHVLKLTHENTAVPTSQAINYNLPVFNIVQEGSAPDADLLNGAAFQFRVNCEENLETITLSNTEDDHDTIPLLVAEINSLLAAIGRSDVIASEYSDIEDNRKFQLEYVEGTEVEAGLASAITTGDYFTIENNHYVWFDTDGITLDPQPAGFDNGIKISLDGTETEAQVAERVADAINNEGSFSVRYNDKYMRIFDETYKRSPSLNDDSNGSLGFVFGLGNSPQGVGKSIEIYGEEEDLLALGLSAGITGSAQERELQLSVSRQDTALSEVFDIGGDIALNLGYHGSSSGVNLTITDTNLTISDSSGDDLIDLILNEFATVGDVANHINSQTDFTAKAAPTSRQLPPVVLDNVESISIYSAFGNMGCKIKKDAYLWERKVGESGVVEWVWDDNAKKNSMPNVTVTPIGLTGGERGGTKAADIINALDALEGLNVNFVIPLFSRDASSVNMGYGDIEAGLTDSSSTYTIDAINLALKNHVLKMSTPKIKRHRQGFASYWYGENGDFYEVQDRASELSHARISMAFQKVSQINSEGNIQSFMPWMGAIAAAGMQAAGFYKSITNKFVNVLSFTDPVGVDSGSPGDVERAIDSGVLILEKVLSGNKWIIDQTTYSIDTNFVYNSTQAVYAADIVALDIANAFHNAFVGRSLADLDAATGLSFLASKMDTYKRLKLIVGSENVPLGYRNAKVVQDGPIMYVSVEIKLSTQLLFIPIDIQVSAISTSAEA